VVDHIDRQVGRLLAQLRKDGRLDNTYVIFTSDHGLAIGSHGLMGKQNMYDHSIEVPFIIAGPGIAAGTRTGAFGFLRDLFPTTCELAGIPIPKTVQSRSLAPVLLGKKKAVHRLGYGYFRDVQRMVRDENWKLIFYPKLKKYQLFDLAKDPHELKNLADAPAQRTHLERLRRELAQWFHDEGDELFLK